MKKIKCTKINKYINSFASKINCSDAVAPNRIHDGHRSPISSTYIIIITIHYVTLQSVEGGRMQVFIIQYNTIFYS